MDKRKVNHWWILLLGFLFVIQGCLATVHSVGSVAMTAVSGVSTYKGFSKGDIKVDFEESKINEQNVQKIGAYKKIAIWPSMVPSRKKVKFASYLTEMTQYDILPPVTVQKTLKKELAVIDETQLTKQEKVEMTGKICSELNADGIFYVSFEGTKLESGSMFSFKRYGMLMPFTIELISNDGEVVWYKKGKLTVPTQGKETPSDEEIADAFGEGAATAFLKEIKKMGSSPN